MASCQTHCTCTSGNTSAATRAAEMAMMSVLRNVLAKKPSISAPGKRFDSLYDDSETRLAQA